jgi:hypothetical protein
MQTVSSFHPGACDQPVEDPESTSLTRDRVSCLRILISNVGDFEHAIFNVARTGRGKIRLGIIDNTISNPALSLHSAISRFTRMYQDIYFELSILPKPMHKLRELIDNAWNRPLSAREADRNYPAHCGYEFTWLESALDPILVEHSTQESLKSFVARTSENFLRVALFHDETVVHEDDPIGDVPSEVHLMRDDEHRHSLTSKITDYGQNLADELGVEGRGDLVKQQQARLHRKAPGDRHPLLLPARKLYGIRFSFVGQPDLAQKVSCLCLGLCTRHTLDMNRRLDDVAKHRHMREEVEVLEHHSHPGAQGVQVTAGDERSSFELHVPARRLLETIQTAQERALTRSARADDCDTLAFFNREIDAAQHLLCPKRHAEAFYAEDLAQRGALLRSRTWASCDSGRQIAT